MTQSLMILGLALGAFAMTMAGGLFSIRFRDNLHTILGFSAGAVIAVAFFDLLPEALDLGVPFYSSHTLIGVAAAGFFLYLIIDRLVLLHAHGGAGHDHGHDDRARRLVERGSLGAASMSAHSLLDGLAIGLSFQASHAVGWVVTAAVMTHDFSDGMNTVNLVMKNGGTRATAFRWLMADATAPVIGAALSLLLAFPPGDLALLLAGFGGFFLYIGASDLLPESHHAHPRLLTTLMTLLGAGTLYLVIALAH